MAKTSEQEIKQGRRKRLARGLLLGGAALGIPVLVNGVVSRRARQLPAPQWGEPKTLAHELGALLYQDLGQLDDRGQKRAGRAPILLVHSFGPGHSGLHWRTVAETLGTTYRVVVPDLLGWGGSSRPAVRYTPDLYVDQLRDLLVEVIGEPAYVVASGASAAVAARVAAARPELFLGLGMVAPRGLERRRERPDLRDTVMHSLLRLPLFGQSALNAVTSRAAIAQHLRREVFWLPELADGHIDEHYRSSHLEGSSAALAAAVCGQLDLHLSQAELEGIETAIWIAWGRHAESPSLTHADLWLSQLPNAELQVFEDSGSHPHLEQPETFAARLDEVVKLILGAK